MARGRRQRTGPPGPVRTCVVCRQRQPRQALLRVIADEQGRVRLDPEGESSGRGAWVCAPHLGRLDGRPGPLHRTLRRKKLHADGLVQQAGDALTEAFLARLPASHRAGLVASGRRSVERAVTAGVVGGQPLVAVVAAGNHPLPDGPALCHRLPIPPEILGRALGTGARGVLALGAGRPTRDALRWLRFHADLG